LRAVCLTAVLLFHAPFSWMSGGFLGVSTFFTLSGYLIGTLLIRESRSTGRVDFGAFWDRRLRRLGPALWIGVLGVVATAPWWLPADARQRLFPDAVATLSYVSNWRFMAPEYAYAQLFSDPSPLQHSWSLSIEAQYYLAFPIVVGLGFRRNATPWRLGGVLLAVFALSVVFAVADPRDSDAVNRVYYGTLSRAAEPLAGALLALLLARAEPQAGGGRARDRALTIAAFVAGAAMLASWSLSEVESPWLYRGGFALHAILSAIVIGAVLRSGNPFERLLSIEPLPWIGRLSYGAYVYHWPIFLILSSERTGLAAVPLFLIRVTATIACAWASHRLVEQPVRVRRFMGSRRAILAASLVIPLAVGAATVVRGPSQRFTAPENVSVAEASRILGRAPRISGFGDSTALVLRGTLFPWLERAGMEVQTGGVLFGCALVNRGERYFWSRWMGIPKQCRDLPGKWRERITEFPVDVATMLVGPWDVLTLRLSQDGPEIAFGDAEFDRLFADTIDETIALFREHGVGTIWLTAPPITYRGKFWRDPVRLRAANDPARMRRLNALVKKAAERWPDDLRVIDFAGYLRSRDIDLDREDVRPDGVHFKNQMMAEFVDDWLGPEVILATNELVRAAEERRRAEAE
jgi:peptidoglycan/LPS O-acetylase OafA/YrhL